MPRLLLFLIFCGLFTSAQAQQRLAKARQRSYLTKVFLLTEAQTKNIYEHGLRIVRPDFFAVPVDSFPTDSVQPRPLPLGYYLVAHTEAAQLVYYLRTESDRTVAVLDNQVDLALVVRDSLGQPRPDAQVAVGRRSVPYDAATHTYRLAKAGEAGLAAVTYGERTTFHTLERTFPGQRPARHFSWRGLRQRVLYGFPLKYVVRPTRRLVYDIGHARYAKTGPVGLMRSVFSEDVRDERHEHRSQRWTSYLVFSQPRYRPTGDTLRLKARILRRDNGRLYRKPLMLSIVGGSLSKRLATLHPVRPGTYEYVLPLGDTLGLRPDTYYQAYLEDAKGHTIAKGQFQFEDYELDNAHYTLRVAEKEQRHGQPQAVFVRGTDANALNLLDARVRLAVVPTQPPGKLPRRQVFLPDTLWTHTQALDPLGETRINLPANIFPDVDFGYEVRATFLTADNERHEEGADVSYHHDFGELNLALSHDSVRLGYDSLSQVRPHRATLRIRRSGELPALLREIRLPLTLPLDFQAIEYELTDAAGRKAFLNLNASNADLELRSDRTADSVVLAVRNPHRVPFWYFVYRDNELKYRGYATDYHASLPDKSLTTWHVSLHYNWGGGLQAAEYTVAAPQRQLLVTTDQPTVAYPGQKIKLNFTVTDERGRPVPDADLTAYAYTSKFEAAAVPELPTFNRPVLGRQSRRRFQLKGTFEDNNERRQLLPWQAWRTQLGLDSLRFYKFLYPESGAFYEYQPAPGGLTQLAPFVVDSGRVQAPIAVYVDGQPVYIHYVNQFDAYTMVADSGHHELSIRTATHLVTMRDVYLRPLHKLTLSLDLNHPCTELMVEKRKPELSSEEQQQLSRSLVLLDTEGNSSFATLRQGPRLRLLRPRGYQSTYQNGSRTYNGGYGRLQYAGPFRPDSVLLRRADGLRSKFLFEPLYAYTVRPNFLKMTCAEPASFGSLNSSRFSTPLPLSGFALTEADVRANFLPPVVTAPLPIYTLNSLFTEPTRTALGQGRLELRLPPHPDTARHRLPTPRYILLTQPGQPKFLRLDRWQLLHALTPGRYQVAVLLSDSTCLVPAEPVLIQANGETYLQLQWGDRQAAGALGRRIGRLVRARSMPTAQAITPLAPLLPPMTAPLPPGTGRLMRGQIVDQSHEEGIPGVTVIVKGTEIGTSTTVDGSFALRVPWGKVTLMVSFVGYITQAVEIENTSEIYLKMRENEEHLDEVVVVGYGSVRRDDIVNSTNFVNGLAGKVSGVQIQTLSPGMNPEVRIMLRGTRSITGNDASLIVIDGIIASNQMLAALNPNDIATTQVLKGSTATAIYGARAANGVLLITTKTGVNLPGALLAGAPGARPELPDVPTGDPRLALRRHFRDYAWWRPTLSTDAQGKAHTEVVLPDDVTNWDTFVLGSDGHRRTGSATGQLRAYKGLMAELAGPRFLVAGDRVQMLGKVLNYRPDTAQVTTTFKVGAQVMRTQAHRVSSSAIDTLTVAAPSAGADSVQITFGLQAAGGYADGEQRSIVVMPAGTRERVGTYAVVMAADTVLTLPLDAKLGEVTVRLESDALPTLLSEIRHLQAYAYLCNEQAASKLLTLLLERRICLVQQVPFKGDKAINFLIHKLQDSRPKTAALWGTWSGTAPSYWVSAHVLEALLGAEKAGYHVELNRADLQAYLLHELDERLSVPTTVPTAAERRRGFIAHPTPAETNDQLRLLRLLHQLGAPTDYRTYLDRIDRAQPGRRALDRYLASVELRQQLSLPYQLDSLRRYRLRTELGGVFYADTLGSNTYFRYLLTDRVATTLLAYRVLRAQGGHDAELTRMRIFLLGQRGGGYWSSTYEAASIMATIGPDLLVPGGQGVMAQVRLNGAPAAREAGAITKFPFDLKLPAPDGPLTLHKTGGLPVYATAYQTRWNPTPEPAAKPFTVTTTLAGQAGNRISLRGGQPAELLVTVEVKAEARYVLLEVPIPAGCSYGPAPTTSPFEVHRENLRHQAGIFIDYLPIGKHVFRVALQPRYRGQYTLNPARAELVYFPTKFGRTGSKQVGIQ